MAEERTWKAVQIDRTGVSPGTNGSGGTDRINRAVAKFLNDIGAAPGEFVITRFDSSKQKVNLLVFTSKSVEH